MNAKLQQTGAFYLILLIISLYDDVKVDRVSGDLNNPAAGNLGWVNFNGSSGSH